MGYSTRINWEPLRSVDSSTFTGVYVPVGTALVFPSIIFKVVNNSSSLITVSINGTSDVDVVPPYSYFLYDELKVGIPTVQFLPGGTQIFVKGAAGTGSVYVVTQYIIQN
jgi:hypothetical protein